MNSIKTVLKGVFSQKTRAVLTGVSTLCAAAIITCLVAFYHTATDFMSDEIDRINLGTKIHLHIMSGEDSTQQLTYADYQQHIQGQFRPYNTVASKTQHTDVQLNIKDQQNGFYENVITNAEYAETFQIEMNEGRFFNKLDHPYNRFVVIGHEIAESLRENNPDKPLDTMFIGTNEYKILGVIKEAARGMFFGWHRTNTTMFTFLNHADSGNIPIDQVSIQVSNPDDCPKISAQLTSILSDKFPGVRYQIDDMGKTAQDLKSYLFKIRLVFCVIGFVSALVAGVNICNSMFAIIAERSKEIGIRLAIGASAFQVKSLLTAETGTVCLLSSMLGVAVGEAISGLLVDYIEWEYRWTIESSAIGFLLINIISILSCYIALRKINRMNPITAIQNTQ